MSSVSSFVRVLSGARLVASATAKQAGTEASVVAERTARHGYDISSRIQTASSEVLRNAASSMQPVDPPTDPNAPNPYKSQLYQEQERDISTSGADIISSSSSSDVASKESVPRPTSVTTKGAKRKILPSETKLYLIHAREGSEDSSKSADPVFDEKRELFNSAKDIEIPDESLPQGVANEPVRLKEGKAIPSSRAARAFSFASLGVGLAMGTASEMVSRFASGGTGSGSSSIVANDANAGRLANSLCRMRGAALKLGQMLSIQDESLLPPALTKALRQVRQGADAIPKRQLMQQLEATLGVNWADRFESFDETPFAAASIGQVHRATIKDSHGNIRDVVVKVQYPGVADSIESDLRNLTMLVSMSGLAPKGLFLENVIRVGRDELKVECDYLNEMANQNKMKELVEADPVLARENFYVPEVFETHSVDRILTSEYVPGGTIDKVSYLNQDERNRIGRTILYLTMKELFEWRLMQTDPNWGNFLYDTDTKQTSLIDFGATRSYSKDFVDGYLRIVWANANRDEHTLMELSKSMGFLTGDENDEMLEAHKQSGFTVGEPFWNDEVFDFRGSKISTRMRGNMSTFLKHRLTPPPEEVYTLHRKLAGAYMLCIKLGAVIRCRDLLEDIVANHTFEDGLEHPMK